MPTHPEEKPMVRKAIGEGWKAYLGGLRDTRRNGRAEALAASRNYPFAVPRPRPDRTVPVRDGTRGAGDKG